MSPEPAHDHPQPHGDDDDTVLFTPEFWDARYGSAEQIWSGNPNPHLLTFAADLTPGAALDVGAGEGADALWLAQRGWEVTAIDISQVALDRGARHAESVDAPAAERIVWSKTDVLDWDPGVARYDLVSAQFMHLPEPDLRDLHRRLAAAVRPGGILLVVGHHPSQVHSPQGPNRAALLFTAEDMGVTLDPADWTLTTSSPERTVADADGQPVVLRDAVLLAVRRG
jgi:SAM-dependent methyltransferase